MHWRKHVETLKTHGIDLPETYRYKIYRHNGVQNWAWMHKELGLNVPEQTYLDQADEWYFNHLDEIKIRDGIIECLSIIKERGLKQGVVSSGRKTSVMMPLEAKGLTEYMDFILCNEDYEGNKPNPAPYLAALKKVNGTGQYGLAIEDDPKGVESAKAAGLSVIHRKLNEEQDDAALADAVCITGHTLSKLVQDFLSL